MDIVLHYWGKNDQQVKVRYWESKFLGHAAHQDLLTHFNQSLEGINTSKVIQVSMDGPSVNMKFYQELVKYREDIKAHKMIDMEAVVYI